MFVVTAMLRDIDGYEYEEIYTTNTMDAVANIIRIEEAEAPDRVVSCEIEAAFDLSER
ncbi:MAG: hypothetical protein WC455_22610 [Dehalococcoidia bacterium]